MQAVARLTGADVTASEDPTGAAAKGGDWDLEYRDRLDRDQRRPGQGRAEPLGQRACHLYGDQHRGCWRRVASPGDHRRQHGRGHRHDRVQHRRRRQHADHHSDHQRGRWSDTAGDHRLGDHRRLVARRGGIPRPATHQSDPNGRRRKPRRAPAPGGELDGPRACDIWVHRRRDRGPDREQRYRRQLPGDQFNWKRGWYR